MIRPQHLREHVIRPALRHMGLWSEAAEDLVLGTAAQESRLGTYLVQVGGGPALGIFQVEPRTHTDLYKNYLSYRPPLMETLRGLLPAASDVVPHDELIGNLRYATAICRLQYKRAPAPLPAHGDIAGYAAYWKRFYNTPLGAGAEEEFVINFRSLVGEG